MVYITEDIIIAESCDDAFIIWRPVVGAELYRLQFLEENIHVFYDGVTQKIPFVISLSDPLFKERIFSVKVNN